MERECNRVPSFLCLNLIKYSVIEHKVEILVLDKFKEEAWDDCFIVDINHHGGNKLDVFIDSDSGISFDKCRKVSRHIEAVLDEELWLGEKYTLEVSSPGIGRPLQLKRQYLKNIGRGLKVKFAVGEGKEEGKLIAVTDEHITIERLEVRKEGKKKIKEMLSIDIPYDKIREATVQISFK